MSDVFRSVQRELTDAEKATVAELKDLAGKLHDIMASSAPGGEIALAKTKLEEAVMWAVKGITG